MGPTISGITSPARWMNTVSPQRLINALGIRHVGEETAALLAENFGSIEELAAVPMDGLMAVPSIGPRIADSVRHFFASPDNVKIVAKLKQAGLAVSAPAGGKPHSPRPLDGLEFVITGRLAGLSRAEAEERIRALGGSAKSDITRRTDYLVVGEEPGSKLARAASLGVKQIAEDELMAMLDGQAVKKGN